MSEQMYISGGPCSFFVGDLKKVTLGDQLDLCRAKAEPEIYHYLAWWKYFFYYTKKNVVIELLEVVRPISICKLLTLLSKKGYRSAALQELLPLVQRRSPRGLPDTIVLPTLDWSKLKTERSYIMLNWEKDGWHIGGVSYSTKLKPGWRVACVKIWD